RPFRARARSLTPSASSRCAIISLRVYRGAVVSRHSFLSLFLSVATIASMFPARAVAQELDRTILPIAQPPFHGTIGTTYSTSTPAATALVHPPAGAPNVLLILIDDAGYAQSGTFGGLIPTPTLDRVAKNGL